ncbi:MAG: glycosyltransferase family 2 protein [Sphingomonadales bacterium]|nr:MAG: glycosyltransferase family 2 protein [Sphingomonadales bacterium]
MCIFTVFTPTYNRAHSLLRVYESLKRQTFKDFEWLIVDDGSTDGTRDIVETWLHEREICIRYFWQLNGHKKTAFNNGVSKSKGKFFIVLDSDDEAMPHALEVLYRAWNEIPPSEQSYFCGVTGLCRTQDGDIVGSLFPYDVFDCDVPTLVYRFRVTGEKWGFHRTDLLKEFPFPEDIKGHVPEGIVWKAIGTRYKTRWINEVVRIYYSEVDSITNSSRRDKNFGLHAEGLALWAREELDNYISFVKYNPLWFIRMAVNYTRFHLHLRYNKSDRRWKLRRFTSRVLVFVVSPVGFLLYCRDRLI